MFVLIVLLGLTAPAAPDARPPGILPGEQPVEISPSPKSPKP